MKKKPSKDGTIRSTDTPFSSQNNSMKKDFESEKDFNLQEIKTNQVSPLSGEIITEMNKDTSYTSNLRVICSENHNGRPRESEEEI